METLICYYCIIKMGSSGQLYSLSWGEFSSSLASAVQLLRGHGDLVDVTLAAGGRSFPAHKIVLCAASPFLLDLLKSTPCQHPVVMLAGIGADDLESLLEFVYRGEVSVEPSQLPSLLQAAHCLCIHGLTPPTILTENGEEVPVSAIPTANEALSKESITPYFPLKRRKKRRKSSSSSGKWPRNINTTDNENRAIDGSDNSRSTNYDHKDEDNTEHGDDTDVKISSALYANDRLEYSNHRSCHSPRAQEAQPVSTENSQAGTHQDQISDNESHLHTLMPMQPYSPLHIPQFPGPLNMGFPPGIPLPLVTQGTTAGTASCGFTGNMNLSKIRGASDCPGVCPLCGATLRQARNLRRHLLSSCKYRFSSNPVQSSPADTMMIEVKPEVELSGYNEHSMTYGTDSGSSTCEQIICKPSPLPSPTSQGPNVVSPQSNVSSPTIAR
ncbi:Transcription factor GAGA [Apis cerana cerana]|uniref:Transcription factor GAGA n=1 Tax=Apis cerana cerana TaxID=94128 RepID=A0A2A3EKX3_APICC|nr:Transcription factor GAGA [Apis cerana cerana]